MGITGGITGETEITGWITGDIEGKLLVYTSSLLVDWCESCWGRVEGCRWSSPLLAARERPIMNRMNNLATILIKLCI